MATEFVADDLPAVAPKNQRSDRTINRDLSIMHAVSEQLAKTHWRLKYGKDLEMNFRAAAVTIKESPETPTRMPWTPAHLKVMYGLPLWQGGGGSIARLKAAPDARIYQDAAYWVPLIGTYTGLAREEACGLEAADFNFDATVPYLLVRNNMTRSKDGINPAGLKREARYRVMPLHPELLRLGLRDYVEAIVAEHGDIDEKPIPIFPELYSEEAKHRSVGKKVPEIGGRRFYKRAWMFIVDATHAILPLLETVNGKKADYHSQRTYNQSVLASPKVSQTILDRHMGHASKGTGPRSYNRRALAVGEENELRERLEVLIEQMPVVSSEVPRVAAVKLLPLKQRSRVGSAEGRNAQQHFCA